MSRIGNGHAAAMARLGLAELRNATNPSRESVADKEIGLYGTATQGEIAEARDGAGQGYEQEDRMTLAALRTHGEEKSKDAQDRMEKEKEQGKEKDLDGPER